MPITYRENPIGGYIPNGVSNRNRGLEFVLNHVNKTGDTSGVIYFADDDNTYNSLLFDEVFFYQNKLDFYFTYIY